MEQKKTISELYQECKIKQEMEQQKKEFLAQLVKDFYDTPVRFSPPIPIATTSSQYYYQGKV